MSEFDLIRDYFQPATASRKDVLLGIGDDCALLQAPSGQQLAMSMDTLLAGRHFLPDVDPVTLGHKSLAVNLSDLAAMGAVPAWAMLSISLPQADHAWLTRFMQGFNALAKQYAVQLVGGDTTCGELAITLQITGFVQPGQALRRDAAQVGDNIYVSGQIGDAALALLLAQNGLQKPSDWARLQSRLHCPTPRLALGQQLVGIAHAAIDISDGLLADLQHICSASGVSAQINLQDVPTSVSVQNYLKTTGNWQQVLNGGDDYELVFTAPSSEHNNMIQLAHKLDITVHKIGTIQQGSGVKTVLFNGQISEEVCSGYDHFGK